MDSSKTVVRCIGTLSAFLAASWAIGAEYPVDIKTDVKGKFYVVEKSGTPDKPTLVVKLDGPGGAIYSRRMFDCKAHTAMTTATAGSQKDLAQVKPNPKQTPTQPAEGSINEQLWQHACGK